MRLVQIIIYSAFAVFMSAVLAWGLSAQTARPATATPLMSGAQPVTLPRSMIFSNEDDHGCNWAFFWDAEKSLCYIRLHFPAEVICEPSGNDLVCSYKPKTPTK